MNEPSLHQVKRHSMSGVLPTHYGEPGLRVILCNPKRLFAYWELPDNAVGAGSRLLLRLSESGQRNREGIEETTEIEIAPRSSSLYIDVPFPGTAYTIELVKVEPDGSRQKLLLAQQTVPHTAPAWPPAFTREEALDASESGNDGQPNLRTGKCRKKTPNNHGSSSDGKRRPIVYSSWPLPGSSVL